MSDSVIQVEGIGKKYRLGQRGAKYGTLRDALTNIFKRKKETPNCYTVGGINPAQTNEDMQSIWALKDVSFSVAEGEIVGLIGRNGAGKSTMLKVLSCITEPTEGRVVIQGRVGSLLEVGTGFHMELTGRENIYLNGAILGMRKKEIDKKFDEIVAFAEIDRFIETPVKFYSSGMYVRLAFAVAAHLETEILLVDEVLAVGDVAFQKKCLGKMEDVAKSGRTVIFVSHNMAAIKNLCHRAILMDKGGVCLDADVDTTVNQYLNQHLNKEAIIEGEELQRALEGVNNPPSITLQQIKLCNREGAQCNNFHSDEPITVAITYECHLPVNKLRIAVSIVDDENRAIVATQNYDDYEELSSETRQPGVYESACTFVPNTFGERTLYVSVSLTNPQFEHLRAEKILRLDVLFKGYNNVQGPYLKESFLRPQLSWKTEMQQECEMKT